MIAIALGTLAARAGPGHEPVVPADESGTVDLAGPGIDLPDDPSSGLGVVGGAPAPVGAWNDAVALYTAANQFACSGVLIAPDVVLTAGHCGASLGGVVVGTTDLRNGGQRIQIVRSIVHPDYYTTFDAALLILEKPVEDIAPRPLALDCVAQDYVTVGAPVVIVGFGATDAWANDWTKVLQEGHTTITDPVCADLSSGCYEQVSPGGELVAGGEGVDSCAGDSGGPLYLPTPDDGTYLVGITSRAKVPAETPCGAGGIYVRVDALVDWIEAETGRTLERPDCDGRNRLPSLSAGEIEVVRGGTGGAVIEVRDPDVDQTHRFEIVDPPTHGFALTDPDGAVYYVAPDVFVGDDAVGIAVTDDGEPPLTVGITIPIHVLPAAHGPGLTPSGCSQSPSAGAGLLLVVWTLGQRRRRALRSCT